MPREKRNFLSFTDDSSLVHYDLVDEISEYKFGCEFNEKVIREMDDAMSANGMKEVGYQYIVIDDCWQVAQDAQGNIVSDAKAFPLAMANVF